MTSKTRHRTARWTILLTTCVLVHAARTEINRPSTRSQNTGFQKEILTTNYVGLPSASYTTRYPSFENTLTRPGGRFGGVQSVDRNRKMPEIILDNRKKLENDRFLDDIKDKRRKYERGGRKKRSSYEIRSFDFHKGREGVRNDDGIIYGRNGCSGMNYGSGELETREGGSEMSGNCGDIGPDITSPLDNENSKSTSSPNISPNPLYESYKTYTTQLENYPLGGNVEATLPEEIQFKKISVISKEKTGSESGSQRTGRNENYNTDLIRYGENTGSSSPNVQNYPLVDEKKNSFVQGHKRGGIVASGRSFGTGETLRNGRQAMEEDHDTHEGEVSQLMEPAAVAEPRQKVDTVTSYYDFLINEGSYKFWAVFQVITACLLIYSAFAAIYYAKYTFSMMDYPDYLDEGFFFKRSGDAYVTTTTAKPSSFSFLGLSPQTFQRIMNAISSKKYS